MGVTKSISVVHGHCESKVSKERLVGKKCCSIFNGVELPMRAPRCFCFHTRKTDLQLIAGFRLHCKDCTDLDTIYLSHTSSYFSYLLYISYIHLVHISRTYILYIYLIHISHTYISYIYLVYPSCIYISYIHLVYLPVFSGCVLATICEKRYN